MTHTTGSKYPPDFTLNDELQQEAEQTRCAVETLMDAYLENLIAHYPHTWPLILEFHRQTNYIHFFPS